MILSWRAPSPPPGQPPPELSWRHYGAPAAPANRIDTVYNIYSIHINIYICTCATVSLSPLRLAKFSSGDFTGEKSSLDGDDLKIAHSCRYFLISIKDNVRTTPKIISRFNCYFISSRISLFTCSFIVKEIVLWGWCRRPTTDIAVTLSTSMSVSSSNESSDTSTMLWVSDTTGFWSGWIYILISYIKHLWQFM